MRDELYRNIRTNSDESDYEGQDLLNRDQDDQKSLGDNEDDERKQEST